MLQPRLSVSAMERNFGVIVVWTACFAIFFSQLASCQDINLNEESIEATRIKRDNVPENRDLTVLLVNDQQRPEFNAKVGRYHSVKPVIGLLTATARTFIQDGVTTEYATQILGTTLDNGRIYAQLLTKSSLVLYNKASNVDGVDVVKPTRLHSQFDGQWNVKQDLGFIDPDKFVLKNTDYLAPSKMEIVYPSKIPDELKYWNTPTSPDSYSENQIYDEPTGRRVQPVNEIPRYNVQNEAFNMLDGPAIDPDKKVVVKPSILENVNTLHRHSKTFEDVPEPVKLEQRIKEELNESNIVKVKPDYDLPTFTVKNEFSPIFYYIDNVESRNPANQANLQTKLPKKLFGQKSEPRPKKTFTYAGFADFTTVVGDTVIVFTPNTDINRVNDPGKVNVYPSAKPLDRMATKITFLASDIPLATATYKADSAKEATKITTPNPVDNRSEKALYNDEESLKKVLYDVDDKIPDAIGVQYNNGFDLNLDVIEPSEVGFSTTESTRVTEDLEVIPIKGYDEATEPLSHLRPSATILDESKESAITESDVNDMFTGSEEEADNTAAENDDGENSTPDAEDDVVSTTENNSSDESYEEYEPTTEDQHEVCTKGLETRSVMTTAYKTLTYLTTYFIPLEGTETTTSVKSDVVVESNVGYLTDVVCKTELNIEPTAVLSINIKSNIHSSLDEPEVVSEEAVTTPAVKEEVVPEATTEKNMITTHKDEEVTTAEENVSAESGETDEKDKTTTTTTTETTLTTQERVEVSVSTEHSTTTTEKPTSEEAETEKEDDSDNEVDLIYKTLYTTYTYFTTFFGDKTSSVESHKSIVTNIITSTINLSNLDPSLLGAFNEDEIAPTNVGIGRPTAIHSIIDLVQNKDLIEKVEIGDVYSAQTPTPTLDDDLVASIKPDGVKTYFTTYTFFTTIYVGSDANVCSRREVYTNYVGPEELIPTKTTPMENTRAQFDFRNCKQVKREPQSNEETSSMVSSVSMEESDNVSTEKSQKEISADPVEVEMLLSVDDKPVSDSSENSFVTDVKSSSSKGERKLIENNNVYEDQISSESNIEEIMPSPTLLLQTSYTTFTYFTTMYIGKDSSKIKSRLETITNVVTETITPKKVVEVEETNLPITYYTTFTYWTTLYKDKSTTITSREEIVSNVVTPVVQVQPTVNPIDTTPIDIDTVLPPKELEVELKPSLLDESLEQDDGKATFYTTYTYFTTFYVGNTSQIRSSLETVTNIVDNTKLLDDNILGRKVPSGAADKNLIQDNGDKPEKIAPTVVKEQIQATKLADLASGSPTMLLGTYIDNLFAEVKPEEKNEAVPGIEKRILYSQIAVISGDSTIVTNDNKTIQTNTNTTTTTTTEGSLTSAPDVIESSEPNLETTTEGKEETEEEDDDDSPRKKSRLTFTTKKPTFTPVIRPFASRNRPTFSPKRVPLLGSATIITRSEFTPTITATPSLKTVRPTGFNANRKQQSAFPSGGSARRFNGRTNLANNPSQNVPSPTRNGFGKGSISPTSKRSGFRTTNPKNNNNDVTNRPALPRIRPTATSRLRGGRQSITLSSPAPEDTENETTGTQQEDNPTSPVEEVTEAQVKTTSNPVSRFRRPLARQPGSPVTPRSTTQTTTRKSAVTRGRVTTTTRRPIPRTTPNPLLSLKRQRPNALFPRRNLFRQPDPEPEEEPQDDQNDQSQEILEGEDFDGDNDYESSDRKEQQVSTPSTPPPKKSNGVQIRPFAFRRRTKRQADYGNRKYSNFRRPGIRRTEPEPETEAPTTQRTRVTNRYSGRISTRVTTSPSVAKSSPRQPFIIRGESRSTTPTPSYKGRRPLSRTTTSSSRPKAPRLQSSYNSQTTSRTSSPRITNGRSRTRGNTRTNSRQRNSYENNNSGERQNFNHFMNDGKITITHQIPVEATIPIVNGKITEYKNIITAKPSIETLLLNQIQTTLGPLGNQQLVLASELTELADNGATRVIKFILHEKPTTTVLFTPTTIRGRKTSYSHILPSTVYNVERVTSILAPEINANVPLANLLLSQLLLGNQQQQAINPLLALQGQGLIPQPQPIVQTPVTELKIKTTTYVTTVTDKRETVLPITFRGIPILTTITNPKVDVITATEYITETVVTTPTAVAQPQQFNSLLLPLLLQQQQQQQAALSLQTANPLLGLGTPDLNLVQNNNLNNDIFNNSPKPNVLTDFNSNEDYSDDREDQDSEDAPPPPPPPSRPKNKPRLPKPAPPKITNVVTLYVSGRTPGEFSTVLSTVVSDDTQTVRKREAFYFEDVHVLPSILPTVDSLYSSQYDGALEYSALESDTLDNDIGRQETQSLESILGELTDYMRYDASPTYVVKLAEPSKLRDQGQSLLDDVS